MLEGIFKGLVQWLYGLILEIVEYIANGLLDVFSMDLNYFESVIPITGDILNIIIASGWALLLGNLVFQAAKTMMSGLGFEGEDPKTLFARTFVFAFLLLASRQVCEIGLGLAGTVIDLLQVPSSVTITLPDENVFAIGASWLLVIIVGIVLMWQIVKLFFEIGERYFLVGFLTLTAPWAFAMGGSKNTADIFKGWARMYGSMCFMMVLNVVFLKMLLSAMGFMPAGAGVLPWMIFVVAIARVGRKIDNVVARIGLNPALTGDGLGSRFPGMLSYMVVRTVASAITKTAATGSAGKAKPSAGGPPPPSGSGATAQGGTHSQNNVNNQSSAQNASNTQASNSSTNRQGDTRPGAAGTTQGPVGASASAKTTGTAGTPSGASSQGQNGGHQFQAGSPGTAGTEQNTVRRNTDQQSSRRSSVSQGTRGGAYRPGTAGRAAGPAAATAGDARPQQPPISRVQQPGGSSGTAGSGLPHSDGQTPKPARYSNVPPGIRGSLGKSAAPGMAGTANVSGSSRIQQGGASANVKNQSRINAEQTSSQHDYHGASGQSAAAQRGATNTTVPAPSASTSGFGARGVAGSEARRTSAAADKTPPAPARRESIPGTSGSRPAAPEPRHGGNGSPVIPPASVSPAQVPARRESGARGPAEATRMTHQPPGTAGKGPQNTYADKKAPPYAPNPVGQGTARISGIDGMPGRSTRGKKEKKKKNRRGKGG